MATFRDESVSSNSVLREAPTSRKQIIDLYQALERRTDEKIEKLFIERLSANFNSVFEKTVQESLQKVDDHDDLSMSRSVTDFREEIVALYHFLYNPLVEEHLSENIIAMPTRHRLMHACERLLELLKDFNAKNTKTALNSLKATYSPVLTRVLQEVALKTVAEINIRNKVEKNLRYKLSENVESLEDQLTNLIKAQHIGELLQQLEIIKNKSKDSTYIDLVISQLLGYPYFNAHAYADKYLNFVNDTIYSLVNNPPNGVSDKEKSKILTCLMDFYCKKCQSSYPAVRDCFIGLPADQKRSSKLNFLKYNFILQFPKLKNDLPTNIFDLFNQHTARLQSPKDYELFIDNALKYLGQTQGSEADEIIRLFVCDILNEIAFDVNFKSLVSSVNNDCLKRLVEKTYVPGARSKPEKQGLAYWEDIVIKLDNALKQINKSTSSKDKEKKLKLYERLVIIQNILTGQRNPIYKFRATNAEEVKQLDNIHRIVNDQRTLHRLAKYQQERENSLFYLLYDATHDDKTGRHNETKLARNGQANSISSLIVKNESVEQVVEELVTQLNKINDTHSKLKRKLYKSAQNLFQQLNNTHKEKKALHTLNRDVFNAQLIKSLGNEKNYEGYAKSAVSFSVYQDVFNTKGSVSRLFATLGLCMSALANRVRNLLWEDEFHQNLKSEFETVAQIHHLLNDYDKFVKEKSISEYYTELFILCDNAIRATSNSHLHQSLQRIKQQVWLRFKPAASKDAAVSFDINQIQRMRYSNKITNNRDESTTNDSNFKYVQDKKYAKQNKMLSDKLLKSSEEERAQLVYDSLLLKINNRILAEKTKASGQVQGVASNEIKLLTEFENSLQKIGCPKMILTAITEPLKNHLNDQAKAKTVRIAKTSPLTKDVDQKSLEFAEKIRDMYRYQIQKLIEPHYLSKFIDILVERFFTAMGGGCPEDKLLQHIYNNCQKHSWFGLGMSNAGEKKFKDQQGNEYTKSLKLENILTRAGVVVFDEKGNPTYYTMSENYSSSACQFNLYGFVVLDKDQVPKEMVKITDTRCIDKEIQEYFKQYNTKRVLIDNEQTKQVLESSQLISSVIEEERVWTKSRLDESKISSTPMWKNERVNSQSSSDKFTSDANQRTVKVF